MYLYSKSLSKWNLMQPIMSICRLMRHHFSCVLDLVMTRADGFKGVFISCNNFKDFKNKNKLWKFLSHIYNIHIPQEKKGFYWENVT